MMIRCNGERAVASFRCTPTPNGRRDVLRAADASRDMIYVFQHDDFIPARKHYMMMIAGRRARNDLYFADSPMK